MKTHTETITWHRLPGKLPDAEINVLLSTTGDVDTAYWNGERWLWSYSGGQVIEKALAWSPMPKGLTGDEPHHGRLITVTQQGGTYQTATIDGKRASATSGPERAARALCAKLWPMRAMQLDVTDAEPGRVTFRAYAMPEEETL
jgi:hypothetical protein